ncbi:MAG: tRNA (N(6)-L-threonylcarbamoyladenosine(37)-C(2))-methylthiotransferase MtaB [Clostridiales bacterium]|nr:tRNA (N(6)-L-threonylcarbamoyladenosine(37)-C(2))-methylthiotransferase MtaB [Clostridiales bacterium]MDO4350863.1 tRNA (N(6)-L-threonylcarbamoyladenosine(37)-C(2))-methylthiotransferase MtaB [Eubacteriales bacterium]MDY4009483.1 tRNA (N(6)-L-threonylcarbamoyladenosine(37)-C(2))-methylthiotransferase MtaB [Candidatus Limiplasma sp.]
MQKTVSFTTLGCKVNQYDTQAMLEAFERQGYAVAEGGAPADVYVVNTCTVTGTGDKKSMQLIRRCKRRNPQAELVIAGCLAQRMGEALRGTGARLILGTQYRSRVVELLEEAIAQNTQTVAVDGVENAPYEPLTIHSHEGHTRAVMKIQEGCDNRCTYCIIPAVRGGVRSRPINAIREEAQALARAGFRELVLTGIHLTSYGRDLEGRPTLAQAVEAACQAEGVMRVRLGSLEPRVATDAFASALKALPQVCPQFHLALQSGSDSVLRRMKRGYNTQQFWEAVCRIRTCWPNAAFTTDVIIGFPGETEAEFRQTLAFCEKVGFARLHVFPFSPREGTPAATMEEQVPEAAKADRVKRLIALGDALAKQYHERFLGSTVSVLLEERQPDGTVTGYTPEYIHVRVPGGEPGTLARVRLDGLTQEGMHGAVVE